MRIPLLLLDFSGYRLGFTLDGESWEVDLPDGETTGFIPGAEMDDLPMRSAPIIGQGGGDQSLSAAITGQIVRDLWDRRLTSPAQLATARLFWWDETTASIGVADEIFRGTLRDPRWDLKGDCRLTFTVQPSRRTDDAPFPPALVIDEGRFPSAPDEARDSAVPVVYGAARGLPLVAVSSVIVNPVRLLVSGHPVKSVTIQVKRDGVDVGGPVAVSQAVDGLGATYSYVSINPADYAAGSDLYAEEVQGWGTGGASGELIDRLGDVMEHVVRTYSPRTWSQLDQPRIQAARRILNRIAVGFYVNDRQGNTVMSFLQQQLGAQFPVAFSYATGRLGWDSRLLPRGGDGFHVEKLVYGQDSSDRIGPEETSADEVLSEIELTWGFDGFQNSDVSAIRFDAETSMDSRRAMSRWGKSPILTESAAYVSDSDSAYLLLTDKAARMTRVRWRVEYQGLPDHWYWLPLQSVVLVTDADLGWEEEPCILEAVEARRDGKTDVMLVTLTGA